jgi:hypothetical protein
VTLTASIAFSAAELASDVALSRASRNSEQKLGQAVFVSVAQTSRVELTGEFSIFCRAFLPLLI